MPEHPDLAARRPALKLPAAASAGFPLFVGALLAGIVLPMPGQGEVAFAAVRQCMQPVTSEIVPAPSELLGKQMALRSWGDKARKRHGEDYANWRVAARKVLGCRPATDGSARLQCVAFAAPCRIEQVPGATPPKHRVRQRPGAAIET